MTLLISDAIKTQRQQANLTQEALARKAGIAYSTLAKIERGAIKDPSVTTVAALANVLGITLDELLTGSNPDTGSSTISFVYCDVNGVLVRFFQKAFVSMAEKTHSDIGKVETAFWHYNASVNKGEMTTTQFNKAVARRLGVESIDWETEYMAAVEAVPAMQRCLAEIINTTSVGLLTNTFPNFILPMIKSGLLPDLPYAAIVDSSEVGAIKPEPEVYEKAQAIAGVPGEQILFIDDSRTNLMEAEKLGWKVLWFDDYRPEESVKRIKSALHTN